MKTLISCLLTLCVVGVRGQTCPLPNNHCDCGDVLAGVVTCTAVNEVPQLLPNSTTWLDLDKSVIGPVLMSYQVHRLNALKLTNFYLSNNKIEAIEDKAFDMMYLLTELDLSGNNIQGLTDNTLVGLKSLKTLYLSNNELKQLPQRMFEHVPQLQYLDLENNKLTTIGREFTMLYNLQFLYLASNELTDIAREGLTGLSSLNHLSLFGNKLTVPQYTWFVDIEKNNGTAEIDRRVKTINVYPNPWLCCAGATLYYQHLLQVSRTEKSYDQLNLVCTWPVTLSGRLMASLSLEEIGANACEDYHKSTTPPPPPTTSTGVSMPPPHPTSRYVNFMGGLDDAGAFFILLLFVVLGGVIVGGACYFKHNKKSRVRVQEFVMSMRADKADKNERDAEKAPTRPYKQERTMYGSGGEAMGRTSNETYESMPSDIQINNKRFKNVVGDSTDYSEDEVWNSKQRRQPF